MSKIRKKAVTRPVRAKKKTVKAPTPSGLQALTGIMQIIGKKPMLNVGGLTVGLELQGTTRQLASLAGQQVTVSGRQEGDRIVDARLLRPVGRAANLSPASRAIFAEIEKTIREKAGGRTSFYTSGIISSISTDLKINYASGALLFEDQMVITGLNGTTFSQPGDSGSLIVERQSKRAVGLLIAGSTTHTIANHLDEVLRSLQVNLL